MERSKRTCKVPCCDDRTIDVDWMTAVQAWEADSRVAFDEFDANGTHIQVSTIWLMPTPLAFMMYGRDFYETMIMGGKFDGVTWRYPTFSRAIAGHAEAIRRVKFGEA